MAVRVGAGATVGSGLVGVDCLCCRLSGNCCWRGGSRGYGCGGGLCGGVLVGAEDTGGFFVACADEFYGVAFGYERVELFKVCFAMRMQP